MVDPLNEISQEEIDRIVDEWDARQPDPSRWRKPTALSLRCTYCLLKRLR